jgi:hypothetical protein
VVSGVTGGGDGVYQRVGMAGRVRLVIVIALLLAARDALACRDFHAAPSARWRIDRDGRATWLVTPCGDRFFSLGVNGVDGGAPVDHGRAEYRWADRYPDVRSWVTATRERLARWGFNSAGAVSLPPDVLRVPLVPNLELGRTARFHWVDPFDPALRERMIATAQRLVLPYRGRPYRIGYFSDNEVGWWNGALFGWYLAQPAHNHTKRRLVVLLRRTYAGDWDRFTRDFVPPPDVSSFRDLARRRTRVLLHPGGDGIQVVRRWTGIVAGRYYRLVHRALRAADPDALVFGDRLPIYYDPVAVTAMARWVDGIATNYNVDAPDGWVARYYFDGLHRLSGGKPVLVSEWFFAADENRTGNVNNGHLMTVRTQRERARGAAAATIAFAREADIVGAHWFQFYDHPPGGRVGDGEDYDFGLVDVQDRPYDELLTALAAANRAAPSIHAAPRTGPAPFTAVPPATLRFDDRSLADWPKERALVPLVASAGEVPFGDVYLAWQADGLALALIAMDYHAPELLSPDDDLPRPERLHVDWGIDVGAGARELVLSFVPPRRPTAHDAYEMRAELCRHDGDECLPVPGARVDYFGADQPRITAEALVPWAALGVDRPPRAVRVDVGVTAFHRSRWMSVSGRAPSLAMSHPEGWQTIPLAPD